MIKFIKWGFGLLFMFFGIIKGYVFSEKLSTEIYNELSKGNLYEAQKLIYQVLGNDPHDTDALFAKAILIYKYYENNRNKINKNEKLNQVLELLDYLSKKLNGFYYYHFIKGKVLEELGRIQESIKEYDNSIYYNPKFEDAYISKSLVFWKMQDIDKSFKILQPVKEKYKTKMLIAWYNYQLSNYNQSLSIFQEILNNPVYYKQLIENRKVLNELYFQIMWVNYRKGDKNLPFWINQNRKYNTIDYYYLISEILGIKNDEEAVKKALYNVSLYPDKPYAYFIIYQILKKHSKNSKNYIYFLEKAVQCDIYNLDFKNTLLKEKK